MFRDASSFNSSISNWNVSSVTSMNQMFEGATDFAQNLCLWKDAPAVSLSDCFVCAPICSYPCTLNMFTNSSGRPSDGVGKIGGIQGGGRGSFDATVCN